MSDSLPTTWTDIIATTRELYVTGTRQLLAIGHEKSWCEGGCAIHHPTNHAMRAFPTHWRYDRNLMERLCSHGVGHPDPDHIAFIRRLRGDIAAATEMSHGCDGCCA